MIKLENVSEIFPLSFYKNQKKEEKSLKVLNHISLKVLPGETLSIIGENGSGKTTLLKVIAGLLDPEEGCVSVKGRVGLIMDPGCGFHPDLSGEENLKHGAPLYGIPQNELAAFIKKAKEFSLLGDFFYAPIRTYSQGMYLRLAFSFAISLNPDILLIDDILTVGDEKARQRCLDTIESMKKEGKTIIWVTHDLHQARDFSDRVLWMKEGSIEGDGEPSMIMDRYLLYLFGKPSSTEQKENSLFSLEAKGPEKYLFFLTSPLLSFNQVALIGSNERIKGNCIEWSSEFCRYQFSLNKKSYLEWILSCKEEEIFMEFFIFSPWGSEDFLKSTFSFELPFLNPIQVDEKGHPSFISSGSFVLKHNDSSRVVGSFDSMMNLKEVNGKMRLSFLRKAEEGAKTRLGWLRLATKKELSFEKVMTEEGSYKLEFGGKGFLVSLNKSPLFFPPGIEILFDYHNQTFSSQEASWVFIENKRGHQRWTLESEKWLFSFELCLSFEKGFSVSIQANHSRTEAQLKNLRLQLHLDPSWRVFENRKKFLLIENDKGIKWVVHSRIEASSLLFHSFEEENQERSIIYVYSRERGDLVLTFEEETSFLEENLRSSKQEKLGHLFNPHFYWALNHKDQWQDTRYGLWSERDGGEKVELPWVNADIQYSKRQEHLYEWELVLHEDMVIQRVQAVLLLGEVPKGQKDKSKKDIMVDRKGWEIKELSMAKKVGQMKCQVKEKEFLWQFHSNRPFIFQEEEREGESYAVLTWFPNPSQMRKGRHSLGQISWTSLNQLESEL